MGAQLRAEALGLGRRQVTRGEGRRLGGRRSSPTLPVLKLCASPRARTFYKCGPHPLGHGSVRFLSAPGSFSPPPRRRRTRGWASCTLPAVLSVEHPRLVCPFRPRFLPPTLNAYLGAVHDDTRAHGAGRQAQAWGHPPPRVPRGRADDSMFRT